MPPIYPLLSTTEGQSKDQKPQREPRNLVLFFDGTGNEFTGSDKDTNVVKLLNMMDRNACNQYHYYQTGIGTYDVKEKTVHKSSLGEMKSSFWKMVDQGIGITFDAHVIAGYRFLMQYYAPVIGLLCKGNEEMVPFAYRLYQRHLNGEFKAAKKGDHHLSQHNDYQTNQSAKKCTAATCELVAFSDTFCWRAPRAKTNIKVFFLGLWDCVNSVSVLEKKTTANIKVEGTADIIRHAVAVDERRVKFKPALFDQDKAAHGLRREHIKEVWFPGNHSDVGGGWHPDSDFLLTDDKKANIGLRLKSWKKLRKLRRELKKEGRNDWGQCEQSHYTLKQLDECEAEHSKSYRMRPCQLSDAPLYWMIQEIEEADKRPRGDGDYWPDGEGIKWVKEKVADFKIRYLYHKDDAVLASLHDPLKFGFGDTIGSVMLWNFLEFYPLAKRWELKRNTVRADKEHTADKEHAADTYRDFPQNNREAAG
ncbi:hypothetical protein N0V92_005199 [Colletotrichum tropicale]|nr:hypothetical protein N0V92_005199 [Colletotrichum tropicale]